MSRPPKAATRAKAIARPRRAAATGLVLAIATGCAFLGGSDPGPIQLPIPQTREAIESEIETERSRLLDLLNAELPDADARENHRRVIAAIAARLARLEEALAVAPPPADAGGG